MEQAQAVTGTGTGKEDFSQGSGEVSADVVVFLLFSSFADVVNMLYSRGERQRKKNERE
jgi:hypothetical protein